MGATAHQQVETLATRLGPGNFNRIARRSGVSKYHVSRVLRGLREPSFDVAADIALAAGVSLDELHKWTIKFRPRRKSTKAVM